MKISIIVAASENNVIGINNQLPWHLPKDLAYFKKVTIGKTIIMGRKTYESIGFPLPNRINILITRDKNYKVNNEKVKVAFSLEQAIEISEKLSKDNEIFIIGGEQIFKYALEQNLVDNIYLNRILAKFDGDTFLPNINFDNWNLMSKEESDIDENNKISICFYVYKSRR